jgi:gag-polypeptide of LTR copia-type
MVKLEKQFRDLSLKKNQDPEVWITELEDLRVRLEEMGSNILDDQFMIHILNNLTSDYELQLALMERRVGDKEKPLTVEEIRAELSLRFERLNMGSTKIMMIKKSWKIKPCLAVDLRESVEIVVKLVINPINEKIEETTMAETTVI